MQHGLDPCFISYDLCRSKHFAQPAQSLVSRWEKITLTLFSHRGGERANTYVPDLQNLPSVFSLAEAEGILSETGELHEKLGLFLIFF